MENDFFFAERDIYDLATKESETFDAEDEVSGLMEFFRWWWIEQNSVLKISKQIKRHSLQKKCDEFSRRIIIKGDTHQKFRIHFFLNGQYFINVHMYI